MTDPNSSTGFDIHTFIREEPKLSALNSLVQAVEDADSFVQDLPEVSYEVSKTLHGWVGKKVTRRLKLTTRGIANLRRSGATSSLYEYDRIIKVTMSNISTLVIEYKGAKHPYTYSAPNALEIAHEIQTRMKFFNAAIKKRMTLRLATPYLEVLEGLRATRLQQGSNSPRGRETILDSRISRSTISRAQARTIGDANSLKLTSLINTFLLDKSHEEAKVLKNFLDGFDSVEKNPKTCAETTRQFLSSLKERVMEVRYDALLEHAPTFNAHIETQADVIGREVELCIEKQAILKLHDRLLDVLSKINKKDDQKVEQQMDRLVSRPQSYFGIPLGLEASSKWQFAVVEINEIATLFLPQEKLRAILNCIATIVDTAQFEADRRVKEKARQGSISPSMSLSAFSASSSTASSVSPSPSPSPTTMTGIHNGPPKAEGALSQDDAILAFQRMSSSSVSTDGIARAVSPPPPVSKPVDLSADDLLPILIYVLVHSKLSRLETQCQYMWQLSDPADLVGESGYYLTMLSSAVEYLKQHEDEAVAPPSSLPVSISGSSVANSLNTHNVNLMFDESDSEEDMSPSSSTTLGAAGSWIGSKSFLSSHGSQSSSPSSPSDLSFQPSGSPANTPNTPTTRRNRQSTFVIGSTRSQPPSYFSAAGVGPYTSTHSAGSHRPSNHSDTAPTTSGTSSLQSDLDSSSPTSHGPPCDMISSSSLNSNPSISSSTPTTGLSPSLTLQRSPPSSPRPASPA